MEATAQKQRKGVFTKQPLMGSTERLDREAVRALDSFAESQEGSRSRSPVGAAGEDDVSHFGQQLYGMNRQ